MIGKSDTRIVYDVLILHRRTLKITVRLKRRTTCPDWVGRYKAYYTTAGGMAGRASRRSGPRLESGEHRLGRRPWQAPF